MDLVVGVCFENDGSCLIEVPLMEGSEVPQPGCDLSASFNFKGITYVVIYASYERSLLS